MLCSVRFKEGTSVIDCKLEAKLDEWIQVKFDNVVIRLDDDDKIILCNV